VKEEISYKFRTGTISFELITIVLKEKNPKQLRLNGQIHS